MVINSDLQNGGMDREKSLIYISLLSHHTVDRDDLMILKSQRESPFLGLASPMSLRGYHAMKEL